MTDLEGAVERLTLLSKNCANVMVGADDLRTILDALESTTRERGAMREGLKPFAALAEYYRIGGPLRASTGSIMAVTDHRIGERELTVEHLFRAAALVNGEVSDAS